MKNAIKVSIVLVTAILILFAWLVFHYRNTLVHIAHLIVPPDDLYSPIVLDEFKVYEPGYERTIRVSPKYSDSYVIGLINTNGNFLANEFYQGELKAEFYWKDRFLFTESATKQLAVTYSDPDMKFLEKIMLIRFRIPLLDKYRDDISIRLIVVKADEKFKKYASATKLYVSVSPSP